MVGFSKLAGSDEERTLARLRALRSDLIDPTIAVHNGRIVKRTGDGVLIDFRSVVDAARCAIEVQNGMIERNTGLPPERRSEFRVGIHRGDVVEESDGDLMGDGVRGWPPRQALDDRPPGRGAPVRSQAGGLPDTHRDDERVRATVRGIRRSLGAAPNRKAPATAHKIVAMAPLAGERLSGIRDRALLLIGFAELLPSRPTG